MCHRRLGFRGRCAVNRQADDDSSTDALFAFDTHRPMMQLDVIADNPQPQSEAAGIEGVAGAVKGIKNPTLLAGGDADPLVAHGEQGLVPLAREAAENRFPGV